MSGKTNEQKQTNPDFEAEGAHSCFITASNDSLVLDNGCSLAIIDKDGRIIQQGSDVTSNVFEAMSKAVIRRFCDRFKTFSEADFKQLQ